MQSRKKQGKIIFLNFLIFFTAILLYGSVNIDLSIKNAYPFVLLSVLTAFCVFSKISYAAAVGFVSGIFIDSISSKSYCFNTIALMLLGVAVCLLANNIFNKNFKAVLVLCFLTALLYFFLYWLVFIAFSLKGTSNITYLLNYVLPSSFYTAVFVIPFYFLYRYWNKLLNE